MTAQDFWHVSDPAVVLSSLEFKSVMAWFVKHGVKTSCRVEEAIYPGNLKTTNCVFAPGVVRATADVLASPSTVLSELHKEGLVDGPDVYVPYPDVEPVIPNPLPPPHDELPPAVGLPHVGKEGWWDLAEGTKAAPEGAKIKGPDGRMYVSVAAISPFGKEFHYELAEEEVDAPAAPAPQAPISSRVPEFEQPALDLGAILALLAAKVSPEVFAAILALVAPKPVAPAPVVAPTVKFLKEDGSEFPTGAFVDHKVARKGKTVITAPVGSHISRITYTNGKANMASPQGQFPVDASGKAVLDGVQFNYPEYGVVSKEAIHYFFGPPAGTDWKPFGELFETTMFNVDAPWTGSTGVPRT